MAQVNRHQITWDELWGLVSKLPSGSCWGVPRGGAIVAGYTRNAVDHPEDADYIVDDIIDSGRTRDRYRKMFPDKQFIALIDKKKNPRYGWVVFPWEGNPEQDIEDSIVRQLEFIGEDASREGLLETPGRIVKAWKTLYAGYDMDPREILKKQFTEKYDEIVLLKDIEIYSTCEHHMMPFHGRAHIAYIPAGTVVGLSKLARLLECFARRLQIQERICNQVVDALEDAIGPKGSACIIECQHFCMTSRGVEKQNSIMVTSALRGCFLTQPHSRAELMTLIS